MTKKKGMPSKLAQLSYSHRKLDQHLLKLKRSEEELAGILGKLELGKRKK